MAKKNTASRAAVWVILLLLIVGLAGFGANSFGGNVRSIGKVGDRDISIDRYAREMNQELSRLSQQFGTPLTFAQAQMFGIDRSVLQRIVSTVALENEAEELGISVGDARVRDELLSSGAFAGVGGTFDREGYRFALERAGLSESEYEESLRYDMSRSLLQDAVSGAAAMPAPFIETLLLYGEETRDITWAALAPEDLETPVSDPTEGELRSYWEANPDDFMLPETRDITYAWLTPEMITGSIEGDDAALQALYDERSEEFNLPERRLVERLTFAQEADAQAALDAIAAGDKTFEDLVAERSLTLADVDLGDVARDELGAAGDAVFALDAPGLAGPVETDLGYALFRMNGVLPAQETTFEEAREGLLVEYRTDAARRAIGDRIDAVDDLLAGGATLEDLAAETDMELGQIAWTEGATDGIAAFTEFRQAALDAEAGDFPEVLETSDGAIFAIRINEVTAPMVEPFEAARDKVEAEWRRVRTLAALTDQAAGVADLLASAPQDGEVPPATEAPADEAPEAEDTAAEDDSSPETPADAPDAMAFNTETGLGRDGFVPDVPTDFVDMVFGMEPDEVQVIQGVTAVYVVRLDAVTPPDLSDPEMAAQTTAIQAQLGQVLGQDILNAYAAAVQTRAGIALNQAALNAVNAQFSQ